MRNTSCTVLAAAAVLAALPHPSDAQMATLRLEENFRREPNGVVLARLSRGASLRATGAEGNWTRIDLEGWIWLPSVEPSPDAAFDLVVAPDGGENLRAAPSGTIVARLEEGALLTEVGREGNWAQVTRTGWVWSASLDGVEEVAAPVAARPAAPSGSAARRPGGFVPVGGRPAPVLTAPDGDTLAVASPGRELQLLGREGGWARVRVEGWMWLPEGGDAGEVETEPTQALEPSDLTLAPDRHNGRVVSWSVQFISLERAEAVRTDFFEGEPFLLTRFGGGDGPFVYVAVPGDRISEVEGLVPLETVTVTARVRTGASVLTGTPIVDLLTLERTR